MDKERFLQSGLMEQYVLGLTSEEESEEVERYADAFPEIQAEIDHLRRAVREYAEQEIASPGFKKSTRSGPAAPLQKQPAWSAGHWLTLAGFLVLGLAGIYYHQQANQMKSQYLMLHQQYASSQAGCELHQEKISRLEDQLAFYHHHLTRMISLKGTPLAPGCKVRIYWNDAQKTALAQVLSLPELPQHNQYQIWADTGDVHVMVSLGLLDAHSHQPQPIAFVPKANALNITLEPQGGSLEPNVDQLYANVKLQHQN